MFKNLFSKPRRIVVLPDGSMFMAEYFVSAFRDGPTLVIKYAVNGEVHIGRYYTDNDDALDAIKHALIGE